MDLKSKFHSEVLSSISFGLMDGITTVLGIMIGVFAAGGTKEEVIVASLAGGFADSFANAVGAHVSQEVEGGISQKTVWRSTFGIFLATVLVVFVLVLPLFFFSFPYFFILSFFLAALILIGIGRGLLKSWKIAGEYIVMATLAGVLAYLVGNTIKIILRNWVF